MKWRQLQLLPSSSQRKVLKGQFTYLSHSPGKVLSKLPRLNLSGQVSRCKVDGSHHSFTASVPRALFRASWIATLRRYKLRCTNPAQSICALENLQVCNGLRSLQLSHEIVTIKLRIDCVSICFNSGQTKTLNSREAQSTRLSKFVRNLPDPSRYVDQSTDTSQQE